MNDRSNDLIPSEIRDLFDNKEADVVWSKATLIIKNIRPDFDFVKVRSVFEDVISLFKGTYPEYSRIKTPYHDLSHTLSVFICAVRLTHGVHICGDELNDEELNLIMIAALLHDIGYAQRLTEDNGSGAQFLFQHINRGIAFSQNRLHVWNLSVSMGNSLGAIIRCTDLQHSLDHIPISSTRLQLMGKIVGCADIIGQMADRTYLEKLLFLYLEFEEAHFGNYQDMQDMLKKTRGFYEQIRITLDSRFDSIYKNLQSHFKVWIGNDRNYYLESVENNITYLDKVIALEKSEWVFMLKRLGVFEAIKQMSRGNSAT
jgi:hypothetical protein